LGRFKQNITTTTIDGDPEETERRRGLARYAHRPMTAPNILSGRRSTFEKIEETSRILLAKGAVVRFLDKGADSGAVVKLVERLRQAIVCYQASEDCIPVSSTADAE
jgi:hypothetical protein